MQGLFTFWFTLWRHHKFDRLFWLLPPLPVGQTLTYGNDHAPITIITSVTIYLATQVRILITLMLLTTGIAILSSWTPFPLGNYNLMIPPEQTTVLDWSFPTETTLLLSWEYTWHFCSLTRFSVSFFGLSYPCCNCTTIHADFTAFHIVTSYLLESYQSYSASVAFTN